MSRMNEADATLYGLFVAAAVPPFVSALGMMIFVDGAGADAGSILGLALLLSVFSLPVTFILGAPFFMAFRFFNLVRWWSAMGSGVAVVAAIAVYLRAENGLQARDFQIMFLGASSGLAFWAVWRLGGDEAPQSADVDAPHPPGLR
ncbi:hypothetical protein [Variovorax sp. RO1]|uniref:hypothetical protein n=1 Tax=Variovorax sp. RO1 TaxID=2066034 RepID=UPI000C71738F|nr:hypothetical protein [Variovorax sp. RO1]